MFSFSLLSQHERAPAQQLHIIHPRYCQKLKSVEDVFFTTYRSQLHRCLASAATTLVSYQHINVKTICICLIVNSTVNLK